MFCIYCGASNPEDAAFCSACGKAVGTPSNPAIRVETPRQTAVTSEKPIWNAAGQTVPQASLLEQPPQPLVPYQSAGTKKGKPVLWILAGFGACLLIVITVAMGFRLSQSSSGRETPPAYPAPDTPAAAVPVAETAPAPAPAADSTPAPVSAPVQPAPPPPAPAAPAVPQNPIVGDWKATTMIGSSIELHFGADGRYTLKDVLDSQEGVYVFSSGDGTLRLQPNAVFSHDIVVWSCQLSGDSFSCVDPNGAGHVYTRVK